MLIKTNDKTIVIDGRAIGKGFPPYIVAELSANHNGSIEKAFALMEAAKKSGADAVKLQTYTPDTITIDCDKEDFKIKGGLWDGHTLYELYKKAYTPFEWHKPLFEKAKSLGLTCFSSPFDETAVELLEGLHTPAYKIASFELIDLPLIECVAKTGKPMILSTGMANLAEIEEAVDVAKTHGCGELMVLHCISSYPAPIEQSNLHTIADLSQRLKIPIGLSDHTMGVTAAITAVALGACFIEKHFVLNREDGGPDASFSLEPDELTHLCSSTKDAWLSLGEAGYERKEAESENVQFRRSLYVVKDIVKGEAFTHQNIRSIRPGFGLPPQCYKELLVKHAAQNLTVGTALCWDMVN